MYKKILKELLQENEDAINHYSTNISREYVTNKMDIYKLEIKISQIQEIQNFIKRKLEESNIKIK